MLEEKHALKGVTVRRITFNEITRTAIRAAMAAPRELDQPLIEAYLARRALDYLVGFTLSPVLWRKLPGSRSAGRVQSVALRLICEREAEIEAFRAREYWTVEGHFKTPAGAPFTAKLTHFEGRRLEQFDLSNEAAATRAKQAVDGTEFAVASVERRRVKRHPQAPFTTSTLQQEASRKLGFGTQQTMRLAQQLYEGMEIDGDTVGLITYMRTDGVTMAGEAVTAVRAHVGSAFGPNYLPTQPREYHSKAKNAQEAHEAIRPTNFSLTPDQAARYLNAEQRRLYDLVWKRAVASQMQSAELDQVSVELAGAEKNGPRLRATGSIIAFDGFLKLYREDSDDSEADDENRMLPPMAERDPLARGQIDASQHFTQPPPCYSEASLVKKMEELGIGRPSTYASIISVLQDRNYVVLDKRRFVPEDRGRLVTAFLTSFFTRYVDTNFTASLEEQLDEISDGRTDWREVMRAFWAEFSKAIDGTKDLKITDVINALDEDLGSHFFPARGDGVDPRGCPACGNGRLGLKLGRYGSFIGCSNYPVCQYTRRLAIESEEQGGAETLKEGMRVLGRNPGTGEDITVRRGPYGLYVQQGEAKPEEKVKPRRTSLPRGLDGETITLDQAIGLLGLPRVVGQHPETKEPIEAGIGRFGPYVRMGTVFGSLDKDDDVLVVGLNRAVDLLAKKLASVRSLGPHPKDAAPVMVKKGRFGPYAQHGQTVANLPRDVMMDDITLDQAVVLLAEKGKVLVARGGKKRPGAAKAGAAKNGAAKNGAAKNGSAKNGLAKPAPAKAAAPKAVPAKTAAPKKSPAKKPAAKPAVAAKTASRPAAAPSRKAAR